MMSKIGALLFLMAALCWSQTNTQQYPINVHVSSSQWIVAPTNIGPKPFQKLTVLIDGKKYELQTEAKNLTLLALGNYKARLIEDVHKNSYESSQTYEFQFPDGKTKRFYVVGQTE